MKTGADIYFLQFFRFENSHKSGGLHVVPLIFFFIHGRTCVTLAYTPGVSGSAQSSPPQDATPITEEYLFSGGSKVIRGPEKFVLYSYLTYSHFAIEKITLNPLQFGI